MFLESLNNQLASIFALGENKMPAIILLSFSYNLFSMLRNIRFRRLRTIMYIHESPILWIFLLFACVCVIWRF